MTISPIYVGMLAGVVMERNHIVEISWVVANPSRASIISQSPRRSPGPYTLSTHLMPRSLLHRARVSQVPTRPAAGYLSQECTGSKPGSAVWW